MTDEFRERLIQLKSIMEAGATYGSGSPEAHQEYEALRLEWLQHARFKHYAPQGIKENRTLSEFRTHAQDMGGYKVRREYIKSIFADVLAELENQSANPADSLISGKLTVVDSDHIKEAWQKGLDRRTTDPEGAITIARTLLESVCKHILAELGENHDDKTDLPKLYGAVANKLNLSPAQHTEQIFKQILGGCHSVVEGLGALRNRHSDAHGKVKTATKASERHAELAVNLSGSMALFLLSTFEHKQKSLTNP